MRRGMRRRQAIKRYDGRTHMRFTDADVKAELEANAAENHGVARCPDCNVALEPSQQSKPGVTRGPNELRRDHVFPRNPKDGGPRGAGTRANLEFRCAICNEIKSNDVRGTPVYYAPPANDNGTPR
jgi:hypothetical protein